MTDVFLIRKPVRGAMRGLFIVVKDGEVHQFSTLERPWLNNRSNISCIPAGQYTVDYLPRSASGKYRKVWHIKNVKGRSGILIHNGNFISHTKGCILLGNGAGILAGKPAVLSSRTAMRKLRNIIGEESFTLHIIGNQRVV